MVDEHADDASTAAGPQATTGWYSGGPPTSRPSQSEVQLVDQRVSPLLAVVRRVVLAAMVVVTMVLVVYLDRSGYRDVQDPTFDVSLLDALYYATVSLSTTGYGDILPVTPAARAINIAVVTPLRIVFLLILIGTTLEALTERSRQQLRVDRWRRHLQDHVVVCGYGTKGRSAVAVLTETDGVAPDHIVVVDPDPGAITEANAAGLAGIVGDATRREVLRRAEVGRARAVIVAPNRDDAAVLTVLTVRQEAPTARIAVSVRESENVPLLRQSGADSVITSSEASGRLLGLSTDSPTLVGVLEDLLVSGQGLDLQERPVRLSEVGRQTRDLTEIVVAVSRGGELLHFDDARCGALQAGDQLVVIRGHRGNRTMPAR